MYSCIVSVLISMQMCFQLRLACTNSVHSIRSGGIKGSPFVFRMVAEQPGSFESLSQATLR